jgi:hypothetical protein
LQIRDTIAAQPCSLLTPESRIVVIPKTVLPQAEAEAILRPYLADIFDIIMKGAEEDYRNDYSAKAKATHTASARANNRHCAMMERAALLAAKHPEKIRLFPAELKGLRGIVIDDRLALVFKKQKEAASVFTRIVGLRSRAILTGQRADYLSQANIPGMEGLCHLEAGYSEDPYTGAIVGAHITCPGRWRNYWQMDLSKSNDALIVTPLFEQQELVEDPAIVTRREPAEILPLRRKDDEG